MWIPSFRAQDMLTEGFFRARPQVDGHAQKNRPSEQKPFKLSGRQGRRLWFLHGPPEVLKPLKAFSDRDSELLIMWDIVLLIIVEKMREWESHQRFRGRTKASLEEPYEEHTVTRNKISNKDNQQFRHRLYCDGTHPVPIVNGGVKMQDNAQEVKEGNSSSLFCKGL